MYLKVQIIGNGISVKCVFITETRHTHTDAGTHMRRKVDCAKLRHHIILLLFTPMMRLIECAKCGDDRRQQRRRRRRQTYQHSTSIPCSALNESETEMSRPFGVRFEGEAKRSCQGGDC